jgi:two-component system cell cycle response regulator CpdR
VSDGQEALEALSQGGFDLLVADIVMPVLDGIALALVAARHHPGLRILLITGYAAERRRAVNLDALIDGVLEKPFSLAQLQREVRAVLGRAGRAAPGEAEEAAAREAVSS